LSKSAYDRRRRGNFDGKLAKSRPEFSGPGRIVGMKGADRALLRKVLEAEPTQ